MSWYRTYRPQTVGGLHITSVRENLSNMLKSGNIPHALLFAGSKGTGKTSSARIIAKVLNCEKNAGRKDGEPFVEPCNECSMCVEITKGSSMNVVELDGASNRRIDDIRQLKERLYMPPAQGKKAVYIIDEVHMLTKEAFNALLKMLEEPPAHVVFIFATTDPQKIPDTIVSRCTRVQFLRASDKELALALAQIAEQEKITVDAESLDLIAQSADGSFRDAVKVFEQLANQVSAEKITFSFAWVSTHLSTLSSEKVKTLLDSILAKDEMAVVTFFQQLRSQDIDPVSTHKQILTFLHQEMLKCFDQNTEPFARKEIVFFLLKQFSIVEIPLLHPFPLLPLELCALEMVLKSKAKGAGEGGGSKQQVASGSGDQVKATGQHGAKTTAQQSYKASELVEEVMVLQTESSYSNQDIIPTYEEPVTQTILTATSDLVHSGSSQYARNSRSDTADLKSVSAMSTSQQANEATNQLASVHGSLIGEKWQELLKTIGKRNLSLEAILRSAQFVAGDEGRATIKVFYGFHKEQLELDRYRILIEQAIHELVAGHVRFDYVLSTQAKEQSNSVDSNVSGKQDEALVSAIEDALL